MIKTSLTCDLSVREAMSSREMGTHEAANSDAVRQTEIGNDGMSWTQLNL